MAENALWLSSKRIDAATLVASSEEGTLVVGYLQDRPPEKKWRATGCTAEYITFDFGQDVACNALALVGHNLSADATLRLRLAASAANVTAAPAKDSGVVSAWPSSGKHTDEDWPEEFSLVRVTKSTGYRYGRLDIADPTNADGYVQAGRLMAGAALQTRINVDLNVGLGLVSPDEPKVSPFGRRYSDNRGPSSRRLILSLSAINQDDMRAGLFDLQRYCGLARDFAFSLDPTATTFFHTYSLQASFENAAQFESQPIWDADGQVWRTSINIIEWL